MKLPRALFLLALLDLPGALVAVAATRERGEWTVIIANDTCPDYTWDDDEATTRKSFAELVRSHLDEMTRTDGEAPENRDHYTMVTHEALWFLDRYPGREGELARRIREGRIMLSPNLCNNLWGLPSAENTIRNMYPARRLQRRWHIPLDVLHHVEYPGLPWGVPTLLSGCGVRWLTINFLDYDTTFSDLRNPPVFFHQGPDGSRIGVVLDGWACSKWGYWQGSEILKSPELIAEKWIPRFASLGDAFPSRTILAAGTHADTHATSAAQTHGYAASIVRLNADPDRPARLVNGTNSQFCEIMDDTQQRDPFMPTLDGSFGDSWDTWAVSLSKEVADARRNERDFLAGETLIALASLRRPALADATRARRERAEWCWLMLADHAWNGANDGNRHENARLRHDWNEELHTLTAGLWKDGWNGVGLEPADAVLTVFNSLGIQRRGLVRFPRDAGSPDIKMGPTPLLSQEVIEDGHRYLCFVSPPLDGFSLARCELSEGGAPVLVTGLDATATTLDGPFYSLRIDPETGGVASLVHKATNAELVVAGQGRSLCQTIYNNGEDHPLGDVTSMVESIGPVFARLRVEGTTAGVRVTNFITLYADLDRVDFDVRVRKPLSTEVQHLDQVFPVLYPNGTLRVETTAAVIRPQFQPEGDLLAGANPRRMAVQGFIETSAPGRPSVTIAPIDSFLFRQDLGSVTIESLGNDQNHKEVTQDQNGVTDFRFRYSLRAHSGDYDNAGAISWSRTVATPLFAVAGRVSVEPSAVIAVNSRRAIPICLKPADDPEEGGIVMRIWETGESSDDLSIIASGFSRAVHTDLLERDLEDLPIGGGRIALPIRARGFSGVRLIP